MPAFRLPGDWRLSRRIVDRLSGRPGQFSGTARLVPDGQGLRYREEGTLTLGDGAAFPATRDYLWRPDGDDIAVLFADGRPLHGFRPMAVPPAPTILAGATCTA
jgi:hypothetical protein